jgi:LexA DNA binding domain
MMTLTETKMERIATNRTPVSKEQEVIALYSSNMGLSMEEVGRRTGIPAKTCARILQRSNVRKLPEKGVAQCHPERPQHIMGMCYQCYVASNAESRGTGNPRPKAVRNSKELTRVTRNLSNACDRCGGTMLARVSRGDSYCCNCRNTRPGLVPALPCSDDYDDDWGHQSSQSSSQETLTPIQQGYYKTIKLLIEKKGRFPTVAELQVATGKRSPETARAALIQLEQKGWVKSAPVGNVWGQTRIIREYRLSDRP